MLYFGSKFWMAMAVAVTSTKSCIQSFHPIRTLRHLLPSRVLVVFAPLHWRKSDGGSIFTTTGAVLELLSTDAKSKGGTI